MAIRLTRILALATWAHAASMFKRIALGAVSIFVDWSDASRIPFVHASTPPRLVPQLLHSFGSARSAVTITLFNSCVARQPFLCIHCALRTVSIIVRCCVVRAAPIMNCANALDARALDGFYGTFGTFRLIFWCSSFCDITWRCQGYFTIHLLS